jgi:YYY domain-containing protein
VQTVGLSEAFVWFLVVEALGLASFPLLARALPSAPDRGFGLSKVFGLFAFGLAAWLIPTLSTFPADRLLATAIFGVLLLWGFTQYSSLWMRTILVAHKRELLTGEAVFLGLSLFFLTLRFFNPEIVWGEKPMDSTFLRFFVRNEALPPQDPWAAGNTMRYYYVGAYFIAQLLKLTGISVAIGYNLAIATLGGFIGAALYSGALLFLRRSWAACLVAVVVVLSCNPEVLFLSVGKLQLPTFDNTFWASSRVFVSPGFFEYTLWSLLFADLHAHVIAIPFTALVLVFAIYLSLHSQERYSWSGCLLRVLLGLSLGSLFALNTWDFITFGLPIGLLCVVAPTPRFWKPPVRADGTSSIKERAFASLFARAVAVVWDFGVIGGCAGSIAGLFQLETLSGSSAGWGWVTSTEFNSLYQLFQALGFWMILSTSIVACIALRCRSHRTEARSFAATIIVAKICIATALLPALASMQHGIEGQSFGILTYICGFILLTCFALRALPSEPFVNVILVLLVYPLALVLVLEHFYLMDRANTLFKGYMAVWLISAFSASVAAAWYGIWVWQRGTSGERTMYAAGLGGLGCCILLGTALDVRAVLHMQRVPKRIYTLDGTAYLQSLPSSEDSQMIQWLNENVTGTPVMVEAEGAPYGNFSRISMHTGIPIVLGWEYHVQQRGLSAREVVSRKQAIGDIYTSADEGYVGRLLEEYRVDFLIVGEQEREAYGEDIVARFKRRPDLVEIVASFGRSHIFVTSRSAYRQLLH